MIYDIEGFETTMLLIRTLKDKVGYFFRLCSIHCSEDNDFWTDIAAREYKRIHVVNNLMDIVKLNPDKFHYNLNFDNASIRTIIQSVEGKTQKLIEKKMIDYDCLKFAETIMNTLIEKEYYHIVETDDNDLSTIISEIVFDSSSHYEKFSERLSKCIARHDEMTQGDERGEVRVTRRESREM